MHFSGVSWPYPYLVDLKGTTAVSHLRRAPGSPPVFSQRVVTGMAGATLARGCLLDHAAELQAFLDPDLGVI
jgi:hypothetical protein